MGSNIKSFIAGSLLMLISMIAAMQIYAVVDKGIKSAQYNDTKIVFNGEKIDITSQPMITVVKEDEVYGSNYMPVRKILNEMGYGIVWDQNKQSVLVFTEEYLQNSEEWINLDIVFNTINDISDEYHRNYVVKSIGFLEERQTVHVYFDAKHEWDIQTAVIGDKIYVEREGINNFYSLYNIPPILTPNEITIIETKQKEYNNDPSAFVSIEVLSRMVNLDKSEFEVASRSAGFDNDMLEIRNNDEVLGTIEIFLAEQTRYVRKADINPYLIEYGYEAVQ